MIPAAVKRVRCSARCDGVSGDFGDIVKGTSAITVSTPIAG